MREKGEICGESFQFSEGTPLQSNPLCGFDSSPIATQQGSLRAAARGRERACAPSRALPPKGRDGNTAGRQLLIVAPGLSAEERGTGTTGAFYCFFVRGGFSPAGSVGAALNVHWTFIHYRALLRSPSVIEQASLFQRQLSRPAGLGQRGSDNPLGCHSLPRSASQPTSGGAFWRSILSLFGGSSLLALSETFRGISRDGVSPSPLLPKPDILTGRNSFKALPEKRFRMAKPAIKNFS